MLTQVTSSTVDVNPPKYEDWLTSELMEWVRNAPLETDAVHNIRTIMAEYERRKSLWQRVKAVFLQSRF